MATPKVTTSFDNLGEFKANTDLTTYGGAKRDAVVQFNKNLNFQLNRTFENPTFAIDTNFDIKNTEPVTVFVAGVANTLSDNTSFNTGTAATITALKWGIAILTWDGTTATVTWADTTAAMGYATEAAAKAALSTVAALIPASGFASLGYVTVLAGASLWTAGTDALEGGAGGTPSTDTNYYNDPSLDGWFSGQQIGGSTGEAITQ